MKRILLACLVAVGFFSSAIAQRTVTGTVSAEDDGTPVPGVNVIVKGTSTGTVTDIDGKYQIGVPDQGGVLVFSFIGLTTEEIEIGSQSIINMAMTADLYQLSEVVVIGYGTEERKNLTAAVSTIDGKKIADLVTPSVEQQLAGRAAGVQVTTVSGILGVAPRVRVRGTNSISNGSDPLYVIDGVPMTTGNQGYASSVNPIGDISPSDIESIDVLKDGSATAIYGSRGANGVILITTKRGSKGKATVDYSGNIGVNQSVSRLDLLNANEFIEIANEKFTNAGQPIQAFAGPDNVDTDWQDEIFQNGMVQNHNLNVSGGTEKTNYYFSLGYSDQEGAIKANSLTRFTFRSNIDTEVKKWLKLGTNLSFTHTTLYGLNTGENALSGNVVGASRLLPNVRVMNPDHPTGYNITPDGQALGQDNNLRPVENNFTNLAFVLDNNIYEDISKRILANAYAEATIIEGLTFRSQIGVDLLDVNSFQSWDPRHGDGRGVNGLIRNNYRTIGLWNWQNYFSYNRTFADVHKINAVAGFEYQQSSNEYYTAGGNNVSDIFFMQDNLISGSVGTQVSFGGSVPYGFDSYFGRLNYSYKDKYLVSFSVRYDGLSSLAADKRNGTFPGGSLGWRLSEEDFYKNSGLASIINDIKLRGSYAEVGNTNIGSFPYAGLFSAAQYASQNGIGFSQMGNSDLQWELSKKTDFGVELGFLEDRMRFEVDYFKNDVDGLILAAPLAPSLGVPGNSVNKNIGALSNTGWEFRLFARAIDKGDFKWDVDVNFWTLKNEILKLNNNEDILFTYNINRVGEQIGSFYGFSWAGVNPANGNPMWYKGNEEGNESGYDIVQYDLAANAYRVFNEENPADVTAAGTLSTVDDRSILGNSNPTLNGGFTSTMRWKGFDFEFLLRYQGGNQIMNITRQATLLNMGFQNNGTEILERWTTAGQETNVPKLWWGREARINNTGFTDSRFLEKGDFLRLQYVTLGYAVPTTVINKNGNGIRSLRVFAQVQNPAVWTSYSGLDPELNLYSETNSQSGLDNNTNPIIRTVSFGLNLGF
jgi:TonB-dependent starch-binding outer membrane protein SusC